MKKSKTRIFINKTISANLLIYIKGKQFHFLKNVLRSSINDKIIIFDGITGEWDSIILSISRDTIILKVINNINIISKSNDVWLIFSPIKQHRMNIAIQKATELGVTKFVPIITDRTIVRKINYERVKKIIIEASEQSNRLTVPDIEKAQNLKSFLEKNNNKVNMIFGDINTKNQKLDSKIKKENKPICIIIGPEGDFTENERKEIINFKNLQSLKINNNILRSETAVISSLSIINYFLNL